MSNRSSVIGKYRWGYKVGKGIQDKKEARYDGAILCKQRKDAIRKRKLERQNKRKGRK